MPSGFEEGAFFADRYEIKRPLGRGGMGMVYLAHDWKEQRTVALKTLLPKYAKHPQAVARFVREVKAARQIRHPAVVTIHDWGKHDGTLYYAMEYIDGKSVRSWMRERKQKDRTIGLGSTVRVLGMICSALEKAHEHTIHRDLSPENVMVTRDGNVKLLDFGLAKLTQTNSDLTRVGVTLGKLQYSSPEQRADAKNVDKRADIYSMGVMFYEMLSGSLPKPETRLSEAVTWLPPSADAFVEKAMAHDPDDRFASAKEFREELMRVYAEAKPLEKGVRRVSMRKTPGDPGPSRELEAVLASDRSGERKPRPSPPQVQIVEPELARPARGVRSGSRKNWLRRIWARIRGRTPA